jgi:hypothetical protein
MCQKSCRDGKLWLFLQELPNMDLETWEKRAVFARREGYKRAKTTDLG